jgi:hypothetical protein
MELYGTGPWLVIESKGPIAHELAMQAVAQCAARGVRTELIGIEGLSAEENLGDFHGVVVTVPDAPSSEADIKTLLTLAKVIRQYRGSRRYGIGDLLDGSRPEYKVGILQVGGRAAVLNHQQFRRLEPSVCRTHRVDPKSTPLRVDFFSLYTLRSPIPVAESQVEQNNSTAWNLLREWNIIDPDTVVAVRRVFQECIQFYHDPKFTALYRPVSGSQWNRLQYLLFDPDFYGPVDPDDPADSRKKWMEGGARCGRHVLAQLQQLDPVIKRPHGRRSRDQQFDVQELFAMVDGLIRTAEFRLLLDSPEILSRNDESAPPVAPVHE